MSYQSVVEMASSQSLQARISACAAGEGQTDALQWTQANILKICSTGDWDDAWQYAKDVSTINHNPDTGARDDVINDQMILSAVQALRTAQAG